MADLEKIIDYSKRSFDDRWIISKLNSTIKSIDNYLENFDPTKATRCLNAFLINDLSNWYVRLNRKRFWKGDYSADKKMAYHTNVGTELLHYYPRSPKGCGYWIDALVKKAEKKGVMFKTNTTNGLPILKETYF